jgi:hypothetical protein
MFQSSEFLMPRGVIASALLVSASLSLPQHPAIADPAFGNFEGQLIVEILDDGRNVELKTPFAYKDSAGKLWSVPTGTVVNGASIPQAFWSVIGGPFEGKFREASVIHDYLCDTQAATWEDTHLVFYNAMRANDVDVLKAKLMYAAVYNFGPRWIEVKPGESAGLITGHPVMLENAKAAILQYVTENDPSIADIQAMSAKIAKLETVEQLEQVLFENGNCTPIIDSSLEPDAKKTIILCGLSERSKRQAAIRNLQNLVNQLERLLLTQTQSFLPAVDDFAVDQTPEKWAKVQDSSREVVGLIKLGVRSAIDVEGEQDLRTASKANAVFAILSARSTMMADLQGQPKTRDELQNWSMRYRALVEQLRAELPSLKAALQEGAQ